MYIYSANILSLSQKKYFHTKYQPKKSIGFLASQTTELYNFKNLHNRIILIMALWLNFCMKTNQNLH